MSAGVRVTSRYAGVHAGIYGVVCGDGTPSLQWGAQGVPSAKLFVRCEAREAAAYIDGYLVGAPCELTLTSSPLLKMARIHCCWTWQMKKQENHF